MNHTRLLQGQGLEPGRQEETARGSGPAGNCRHHQTPAPGGGPQGAAERGERGERFRLELLARLPPAADLRGGDAGRREPQGAAPQQPGQAPHHQCRHPARRLLPIRAGAFAARLSVAAHSARHPGAEISPVHRRHRPLRAGNGNRASGPRGRALLRLRAGPGRAKAQPHHQVHDAADRLRDLQHHPDRHAALFPGQVPALPRGLGHLLAPVRGHPRLRHAHSADAAHAADARAQMGHQDGPASGSLGGVGHAGDPRADPAAARARLQLADRHRAERGRSIGLSGLSPRKASRAAPRKRRGS